jgi:hypothetical protein
MRTRFVVTLARDVIKRMTGEANIANSVNGVLKVVIVFSIYIYFVNSDLLFSRIRNSS